MNTFDKTKLAGAFGALGVFLVGIEAAAVQLRITLSATFVQDCKCAGLLILGLAVFCGHFFASQKDGQQQKLIEALTKRLKTVEDNSTEFYQRYLGEDPQAGKQPATDKPK